MAISRRALQFTAWKESVFGVFLVRTFLHSLRISPFSVRMLENTDQKNFKYGHFSHSDFYDNFLRFSVFPDWFLKYFWSIWFFLSIWNLIFQYLRVQYNYKKLIRDLNSYSLWYQVSVNCRNCYNTFFIINTIQLLLLNTITLKL